MREACRKCLMLSQRQQAMKKATLAGMLTNFFLSITQIVGGLFSQSQALIADGLHTLSDLISDGIVYLAAHHANAQPDVEHPYGHRRYETLVSGLVGVILLGVAFGISLKAANKLLNPEQLKSPSSWALLFAFIAIAAKEALYHYTIRIAKKTRSQMLQAQAWHHRSDALSSIIVVIGVVGATVFGQAYLDALAAILIAGMLAFIGGRIIWGSLQELVDTALQPQKVIQIQEVIRSVDGVNGFHQLRTRQMGGAALVDVHIQVPSKISVSEGDHIAESVRFQLMNKIDEVEDVTVHVDTENDECLEKGRCLDLPSRRKLLDMLQASWRGHFPVEQISLLNLHYVDGLIELDLSLPLRLFPTIDAARQAAAQLTELTEKLPQIRRVAVYFR